MASQVAALAQLVLPSPTKPNKLHSKPALIATLAPARQRPPARPGSALLPRQQ
ncbi:hypothetical protein ACVBEH_12725 [Roseateles sp. GG27B]